MNLATPLLALAAGAGPWSPAAAPLEPCPAAGPPRIVFPSSSPSHATGAGAIVWDASPSCAGGAGARVASIGAGETPGAPAIPRTSAGRPIAPHGPLAVAAAPHGQIAIAGAFAGGSPPAPGEARASAARALLVQGHAGGPFSQLWSDAGAAIPLALATGYLGDVAAFDGSVVRVERYFSNVLAPRASAVTSTGAGATASSTTATTLALDYRSDALALWVAAGTLYARYLPARGAPRTPQSLARVGAHVRISALLSDAGRATVAWADDRAGRTSVYLNRSVAGVRFAAPPRLLERVRDPDGLPSPPGSPSLVRLSTEGALLAWAGAANGRWAIRTAMVGASGAGDATTTAAPGGDALLAALAPGPNGEALALWSEPQPDADGRPDTHSEAIVSARITALASGRTRVDAPEQVAPPGPNGDATVALDPSDDRAVAAWRGAGGAVRYAVRGALSGAS